MHHRPLARSLALCSIIRLPSTVCNARVLLRVYIRSLVFFAHFLFCNISRELLVRSLDFWIFALAIGGDRRRSKAIGGDRRRSEAIGGDRRRSKAIGGGFCLMKRQFDISGPQSSSIDSWRLYTRLMNGAVLLHRHLSKRCAVFFMRLRIYLKEGPSVRPSVRRSLSPFFGRVRVSASGQYSPRSFISIFLTAE